MKSTYKQIITKLFLKPKKRAFMGENNKKMIFFVENWNSEDCDD